MTCQAFFFLEWLMEDVPLEGILFMASGGKAVAGLVKPVALTELGMQSARGSQQYP